MEAPQRQRYGAIQDTGNPVLDSTVNLIMNWPLNINISLEQIGLVHDKIAELYEKEPKRANASARKTLAQMKQETQEIGAR